MTATAAVKPTRTVRNGNKGQPVLSAASASIKTMSAFRAMTTEDMGQLTFQRFESDQPIGAMLGNKQIGNLDRPLVHVSCLEVFPNHVSIKWNKASESRKYYGQNPVFNPKTKQVQFTINFPDPELKPLVVTLTSTERLQ